METNPLPAAVSPCFQSRVILVRRSSSEYDSCSEKLRLDQLQLRTRCNRDKTAKMAKMHVSLNSSARKEPKLTISSPMKLRMDLRDHWENAGSPA